MAISVTSTPVSVPSGIRVTTGTFDFNATTYGAGGLAVTAAHFGGGSNGIPNRLPDFVIFGTGAAADDADSDAGTVFRYIRSTAKVAVYGTEPLVDEAGIGEDDAAASSAVAPYLAIWLERDPAGITTT